jgi:hypothetical protein
LRYAEDDARRVAATLAELSGYPADAIDVVVRPTPDALRAHLDRLAARVAGDRAAGRQARVVFYYSGHARSTALDLGPDELALGELRQRLFAIPATLTVVVLDACQSGAFSQVKGAEPAADFSFNLRQHLDASGVAVLASSSGAELSQESEQLRSSYFTHHLLVGLRGAGDLDRDGQVSIDEAYRYAYQQTLLATAQTAVGGQHPSLEFDLKGHGNVPLSFPRAASASIELPGGLEGQTLIEDRRARTVVAEIYKARGAPVRIAVAPGEYSVLVRRGSQLLRCEVQVGSGGAVVDLDRCTSETAAVATSKGVPDRPVRTRIELTGVYGNELSTLVKDAYDEHRSGHARGVGLSAMRGLGGRWWLGGFAAVTRSPDWNSMPFDYELYTTDALRFSWSTLTVGAVGRAAQPFAARGFWARWAGYAQLGAGLGIVLTEALSMIRGPFERHYVGWSAMAGAGVQINDGAGVGFSLGYEFDYARVLQDSRDTYPSGGHRVSAGVSYSF